MNIGSTTDGLRWQNSRLAVGGSRDGIGALGAKLAAAQAVENLQTGGTAIFVLGVDDPDDTLVTRYIP